MEGGKNLFWGKNLANLGKESIGKFKGTPEADLARRPRWGGGSLRAFRRAEVIVNALLVESRVGGVSVAMTFASIFHFEFWLLWGVFLIVFLMPFGSLLDPNGVPWSPFGIIWGCFW